MVSVCLPSDALLQHLPSYLGFSYLGVGYLFTAALAKHSRCSLPLCAQYATGDKWRNNSRKNEGMEPKQKQYPVVDVTGDGSNAGVQPRWIQGIWSRDSVGEGKTYLFINIRLD